MTFLQAVKALGAHESVKCTMKGGDPVEYRIIDDELTVNGKIKDIHDFCFAPSQILWGKWELIQKGGGVG